MNPEEIIKPIQWLVGKWASINARGQYPNILPFEYVENITFSFIGQPMLNYSSETSIKAKPKHLETGFLRIKPNTNNVAFIVAHNFGITSIEEGEIINNNEMKIKSTDIHRISFATEPFVTGLARHYKLVGDRLELVVYLETSRTPLTEHLRVIYEKVE